MNKLIKKIYPKTKHVVDLVLKTNSMHKKYLLGAISDLNESENKEVESYINFLLQENHKIETIADGYSLIVKDTFIEELYFREHGTYRYSKLSEVDKLVYHNNDYMKLYMIGCALSAYWWPNHVALRRFFIAYIQKYKPSENKLYREVGPGHGMYFLQVLKNLDFDNYEGVDISQTSVDLTKRLINSGSFGSFARTNIIQGDFLDKESRDLADFLVMGEVIEHVENPDYFLKAAHKTATDNALIFLTTCINAPTIDHLYNPETIENLEELIESNNFNVIDRCLVPRNGKSKQECIDEKLAINVGYFLSKK